MNRNAVNLMARFILHDSVIEKKSGEQVSAVYTNHLHYVDREEAKEKNKIVDYATQETEINVEKKRGNLTLKYIGDERKNDNLFNDTSLSLSPEEKLAIEKKFNLAQEKQSPMWQLIYSFDNEFLADRGLLSKDGVLNAAAIKEATRYSLEHFKKDMGLNSTMTWVAGIHYNTDNIHVHVSVVETETSREKIEKGKYKGQYKASIPKKTVRNTRSKFTNKLFGNSPELVRITHLMRQELNAPLKDIKLSKQRYIRKEIQSLLEQLPRDRRKWRYNMNAMKPYQEQINTITHMMIEEINPAAFKELKDKLKTEQEFYNKWYGSTKRQYEVNKLKELDAMLGNTLLKKLSEEYPNKKNIYRTRRSNTQQFEVRVPKTVYVQTRQLLYDSKQQYLNKLEHERLEREQINQYERDREY